MGAKKPRSRRSRTFGDAENRRAQRSRQFCGAGKGWPRRCRGERDAGKNGPEYGKKTARRFLFAPVRLQPNSILDGSLLAGFPGFNFLDALAALLTVQFVFHFVADLVV